MTGAFQLTLSPPLQHHRSWLILVQAPIGFFSPWDGILDTASSQRLATTERVGEFYGACNLRDMERSLAHVGSTLGYRPERYRRAPPLRCELRCQWPSWQSEVLVAVNWRGQSRVDANIAALMIWNSCISQMLNHYSAYRFGTAFLAAAVKLYLPVQVHLAVLQKLNVVIIARWVLA